MNNPSTKLPIPSIEVFEGGPIPPVIQQRHDKAQAAIKSYSKAFTQGEDKAVRVQRAFRAKRRQKEIQNQILPDFMDKNTPKEEAIEYVNDYLKSANHPEPLTGDEDFNDRLMGITEKIKLFDSIYHFTSATYLNAILDEGLSGKKTLLERFAPFKGGALSVTDLEKGSDANVICFAVNEVDPSAKHANSIKITLDFDKIKNNPNLFFKQRDFGLATQMIHSIKIGEETFKFSLGKPLARGGKPGTTNMQFFLPDNENTLSHYAEVSNELLTAYDTSKIHQILTLNFFRFLANLNTTKDGRDADEEAFETLRWRFYKALKALPDEELLPKLEELGKMITKTAEVDIYGAYKIDMGAIKTIETDSFTLNMSDFIKQLQDEASAANALETARKEIPKLFESYRFLDYLLSAGQYPAAIKEELTQLNVKCKRPAHLTAAYQGTKTETQVEKEAETGVDASKDKGTSGPGAKG